MITPNRNPETRKTIFRASREWNTFNSISLRALQRAQDHSPAYFCPVTLNPSIPEGEIIPPFLTLHEDECQNLMDALWSVGCRPSEGHGSTGQLAAIQKHLEDMRTLVFDTRREIIETTTAKTQRHH
jgi:hypothetical protein